MSMGVEIVRKLIRCYEQGMYTRLEVLAQFVEAAATCPVGELAEAMPSDWLAEIRTMTQFSHGRQDRVYISGVLLHPGIDPEAYFNDKRRLWAQGESNWRRFYSQAES